MIIFHTIPVEPEIRMLINNRYISENLLIYPYTLFGYQNQGIVLSGLMPSEDYIPKEEILNDTESNFDYYYWKQLMESSDAFMQLTQILVREYNHGPNCVNLIQTTTGNYQMSVTESIKGYINAMYGLDVILVMDKNDLYRSLLAGYSSFSREGIARIDQDSFKFYSMGGSI